MHVLTRLFFLLCILALIWLGVASKSLSDCFMEVREKYEAYPALYAAGKITHKQLQQQAADWTKENDQCEQKTVDRFIMPPTFVEQIRGIIENIRVFVANNRVLGISE